MTANMYRVGDYVYFETSSTSPYQIRRIEELIKTPNGNVEAKVMCFFRRRDIATSLVMMADKQRHENMDATLISALEEEQEREAESLAEKERHQLKHRELFLSRQVETLPATHIRGKCSVTLLNETESLLYYLNKDDCFFYSLVFDPQQKTLLADRGEIRVGPRYQAEIPPLLPEGAEDPRRSEDLEQLVYTPHHNLTDRQIDQFLIVCRSVGTFARALDCSSSVKQPSLHMSAAAASRDITLFHAMDILHKHNYDITSAISSLVPSGGPVLCRDEMEEWSASEANLFEEALEKYGKDFIDVRQDFLPWKSLKNVIEYYYMWKTTDRYVQQKRVKAVEAESKLKQVYIPNYNNKPGVLNGACAGESPSASGRPCESCYTPTSSQWYAFGPAHLQCRLCQSCWNYFKRFGGLKYPTRLESVDLVSGAGSERLPSHVASHRPHRCTISGCGKEFKLKAHLARHCATAHGLVIRAGSPRPIMKTRAAFYLQTTALTRKARRYASHLIKPRHAARNPFQPINILAIKQEFHSRMIEGQPDLPKLEPHERGKVVDVSHRLGTPNLPPPEWLLPTPLDKIPKLEREAFPPPPRNEDGSLSIPKHPMDMEENNVRLTPSIASASPTILRKRGYEQQNGVDIVAVPPKRRALSGGGVIKPTPDIFNVSSLARSSVVNTPLNGRAKMATITRVGGRKQMISWVDAPDDVYFVATDSTKKLRKQITILELRRSARKPCRKLNLKIPFYYDNPPPPVVPALVTASLSNTAATAPPETLAVID
ncbi:metastasis-associated protein MTA1 [Trichonephila inaurata madagascariensis]|uniref:Metastasis-associated protein MTA1 n=1 Tax=Trichonephila inaurata madagascariensis TaxID=2747483 RepID=A0A8X7BPQ4_9ARAC|nr:metastasis-associated protein MTA1 [Trichonephila inaurata madagascariensis]